MPKKKEGKKTSLHSPLYVSGNKYVGGVGGPQGGKSPADPLAYKKA